MPQPVRTKRTVLAADVRGTVSDPTASPPPAVGTASYNIVPIYDTFNVINTETEIIELNRARANLDAEAIRTGIPNYRLSGQTYVFGTGRKSDASPNASAGYCDDPSGTPAALNTSGNDQQLYGEVITQGSASPAAGNLPPWTRFLFASGFKVFTMDDGASPIVSRQACFQPADLSGTEMGTDDHWYFNSRVWLGGDMHYMWNARGNCTFNADVGQLPMLNFDLMGVYSTAGQDGAGPVNPGETAINDAGTNPTTVFGANVPPRFCGTDGFYLKMDTGTGVITPKVHSVSLDLGATPAMRRDANTSGCLYEIGIFSEYNPRLTVVIENEDHNAKLGADAATSTFHKAFQDGNKFAFVWRLGAETGRYIFFRNDLARVTNGDTWTAPTSATFTSPANYRAMLARDPVYGDADGIRTLELEFLLTGDDADWLQIILA